MPATATRERPRHQSVRIERRGAERHPCCLRAFCCPLADGFDLSWLGVVVDISTTGISLLSTRRFEPSAFISVELQEKSQPAPRRLLVGVVHARLMPSGKGWVIGCDFIRELSAQELQAILS